MKKRYATLMLCVLMLAAFAAGCAEQAPEAENVTFTAVIDEVGENVLLVTTSDDVGFDKARVSFADGMPDPGFDFAAGQTVRIAILPEIAESYPVQVRAVAIELLSGAETPKS